MFHTYCLETKVVKFVCGLAKLLPAQQRVHALPHYLWRCLEAYASWQPVRGAWAVISLEFALELMLCKHSETDCQRDSWTRLMLHCFLCSCLRFGGSAETTVGLGLDRVG